MVSYHFPLRCCRCIGDAEDQIAITASQHMGTYQLIHSVKVPICRACKRTVERIPIVVWVLAALAITALSAGGAGWDRDSSMAGRILGGGFVGASLGALAAYVADRLCAPAKLDSGGRLEFHSWAYQKLFEGQLPPEAGACTVQPVAVAQVRSLWPGLSFPQLLPVAQESGWNHVPVQHLLRGT